MPGLAAGNIKGFNMYTTSEMWNHGGDVTVERLDTSDALILNQHVTAEDLESVFETDSPIYQWIKQLEALTEVAQEEIELSVVTLDLSGTTSLPGYEQQPYIEEGTTMVPARYVSEELLAHVAWDAAAKQVIITDPSSAQEILLTVNSNLAQVNGEDVSLDRPAVLHDERLYVPLRFIAESLGGEVLWDAETKTVTIIKY